MGGRIQGKNLLQNCETRRKQMRYLLDNMTEPDFSLVECSGSLNSEFDITDGDTLNTAGITFRILNSQGFGGGAHSSNAQPTWGSVAYFMSLIQDYLPKSLRTRQNPYRLWRRTTFRNNDTEIIAEETQELLNDMVDWLEMMKRKIEDYITAHYYREGKVHLGDILKRRFKDEWTEKVEQSVEAEVKTDTNVQIVIEDYTDEASEV